jgi:hypothetical protein
MSYAVRTTEPRTRLDGERFADRGDAEYVAEIVNDIYPGAGAEVVEVEGEPTLTLFQWYARTTDE